MTQRSGGFRARTREKIKKTPRSRGKIPITKMMQTFKIGEKAMLI